MNSYFRPIFCETDPAKAAECLDDVTLISQIGSVCLLTLALEAVAFRTWDAMKARDPGFKPPYPYDVETDHRIPHYHLTAYSFEARAWACSSEPAAKWLINHAVALVTEAEFRGLNPNPQIVKAMHLMLVRREAYAAAFKGNKTQQATQEFPRIEPDNHIRNRDRRLLVHQWAEHQASIHADTLKWTGRPGPDWWLSEAIKFHVRQISQISETLVDHLSLQA